MSRAAKRFKRRTGLGCDAFHPRWVGLLPPAAASALATIFVAMEDSCLGPSAWHTLQMVFQDKPDGGERPLGLHNGIMRLWAKLRTPCCREWERQHARPYWAGVTGQSVEQAVWEQSALAERSKY